MATPAPLSLVGFTQAGRTTNYAGSWRHTAPEHGLLTASYRETLGNTLEGRCFDKLAGAD